MLHMFYCYCRIAVMIGCVCIMEYVFIVISVMTIVCHKFHDNGSLVIK